MRALTGILVAVLALASVSMAGEEPLVKKLDCDKCTPDGFIPEGFPDGLKPADVVKVNGGRKIKRECCKNCLGSGAILELPGGERRPAATDVQRAIYTARLEITKQAQRVARAEAELKRESDALAQAREKLAALEKQQAEKSAQK